MNNLFQQIINVIVALTMLFFAVPKLIGQPQSIEGFNHFQNALSINSDLLRIFTGVAEIGLALLIFLYIYSKNKSIGKLAFGLLLATMLTALLLEFFARPEPKTPLVIIAFILAGIAIIRIKTFNNLKTT